MKFSLIWQAIGVNRGCGASFAGAFAVNQHKGIIALSCAVLLAACSEAQDGPHRDADGRIQIFGPETRLPPATGTDTAGDDDAETVFTVPSALKAAHGMFGSTVKLFVDFRDRRRNTTCTGVLLGRPGTRAARYVLTAAHCLDRRRARDRSVSPIIRATVLFGSPKTKRLKGQTLPLGNERDWSKKPVTEGAAFRCHEEYPKVGARDLCLLRLSAPLSTSGPCADEESSTPCIHTARLPEAEDYAAGDARQQRLLSGFGNTVRDVEQDCSAYKPARVMRYAEVRPQIALPGNDGTFEIKGSHRGATCVPGKPCSAICAGDSGGGLFLYPNIGVYDDHLVLGIARSSFGNALGKCAACLDPEAKTTFVSVLANRGWIEETMTILDERAGQ